MLLKKNTYRIIFVIFCLSQWFLWWPNSALTQEELSIEDSTAQEKVEIEIRGITPDFVQPMLQVTLTNKTDQELNMVIPLGLILNSSRPDSYASLLVSQPASIKLPPKGKNSVELHALSLDIERSFPFPEITFQTDSISTDSVLLQILTRISGPEEELSAQVALWMHRNGLTFEQIQNKLGAQLSDYGVNENDSRSLLDSENIVSPTNSLIERVISNINAVIMLLLSFFVSVIIILLYIKKLSGEQRKNHATKPLILNNDYIILTRDITDYHLLDHDDVDSPQAIIRYDKQNKKYSIRDLYSKKGTQINDVDLSSSQNGSHQDYARQEIKISNDDKIKIGSLELTFKLNGQNTNPRLVNKEKNIDISLDELLRREASIITRHPVKLFQILNPGVHNPHAIIKKKDKHLFIKNICDREQTQIKRNTLTINVTSGKEMEIFNRDYIMLGPVEFDVSFTDTLPIVRLFIKLFMRSEPVCDINGYQIYPGQIIGGMSVVVKAQKIDSRKEVAIKFPRIDQKYFWSDEFQTRFNREADWLERLKGNPNIVQYIDHGQCENQRQGTMKRQYLIMEWVEGCTLYYLIEQEPQTFIQDAEIDQGLLLEVMAQLLSGLEDMHKKDIIHRDIKPSNILLDEEGSVKLFDLGIVLPRKEVQITDPGRVIATFRYAAPEHLSAQDKQDIDLKVDIYSFGASIYFMITRTPPFKINESNDANYYHGKNGESGIMPLEPSIMLKKRGIKVEQWIDKIVMGCLEKDPARRFTSVSDIRQTLNKLLENSGYELTSKAEVRQRLAQKVKSLQNL